MARFTSVQRRASHRIINAYANQAVQSEDLLLPSHLSNSTFFPEQMINRTTQTFWSLISRDSYASLKTPYFNSLNSLSHYEYDVTLSIVFPSPSSLLSFNDTRSPSCRFTLQPLPPPPLIWPLHTLLLQPGASHQNSSFGLLSFSSQLDLV